jgi:hypothetical protein
MLRVCSIKVCLWAKHEGITMSKQFSLLGWRVELNWQGVTVTPPEPVSRYREVKTEAWMQAVDAFVPGKLLLADVPLRSHNPRGMVRARVTRRRSF